MNARTMAGRVGAVAVLGMTALAVGDVAAQTSGERRLFAGAAVAGNIEQQSSVRANVSGGRLAVGVSFGADISRRWSVQVEAELPTADTMSAEAWESAFDSYSARNRYRTSTVAVLFGFRPLAGRRVDFGFQVGPAWCRRWSSYQAVYGLPGGPTYTYQNESLDWRAAISLGAEVAVRVTSRLSIVPQVRAHVRSLGILEDPSATVRPAVGMRVRF